MYRSVFFTTVDGFMEYLMGPMSGTVGGVALHHRLPNHAVMAVDHVTRSSVTLVDNPEPRYTGSTLEPMTGPRYYVDDPTATRDSTLTGPARERGVWFERLFSLYPVSGYTDHVTTVYSDSLWLGTCLPCVFSLYWRSLCLLLHVQEKRAGLRLPILGEHKTLKCYPRGC